MEHEKNPPATAQKKPGDKPRGHSSGGKRSLAGSAVGRTPANRKNRSFSDRPALPDNLVFGRNPVLELIRSGTAVDKIYLSGADGTSSAVFDEAQKAGITVVRTNNDALNRMVQGERHQGVVAVAAEKASCTVEDILAIAAERGEKPLIVVCSGIEDPHNLGAVIRCADCAGAHGVIIPERRACGLTPVVSKASAGALQHMAVAKVVNIAETIETLKKAGVWTFAAEAGGVDFYDADWNIPCAIVLGGEDSGVGRLVRERCDFTVSIPMYGHVNSLNVSTAASVLLCHAARMQRVSR